MKTLPLTPERWFDGLAQACAELRRSWSQDWPGLPAVAQTCITSLALDVRATPEVQAMTDFTRAVALGMETLPAGDEPSYHNRLHTADVMLTITTMLHVLGPTADEAARPWAAATLAAAAAHDFGHPGGVNQQRFDIESRSWRSVAQYAAGLPEPWRDRIESLILHTDPQTVPDNHAQVAEQAFAWTQAWCQVLLNEADILLSASARFGPDLSQALAQEWQRVGFAAHATVATPAGRAQFLRSIRFSSPAALALAMPEQVAEQLQ
jgi:hypothetical protein